MNNKKPFRSDKPSPIFYHEIKVASGTKTYVLARGMWLSVHPRTNLSAGQYEFLYAERMKDGTVMLVVEGPLRRRPDQRFRKVIREADVKQIHLKSGRRN